MRETIKTASPAPGPKPHPRRQFPVENCSLAKATARTADAGEAMSHCDSRVRRTQLTTGHAKPANASEPQVATLRLVLCRFVSCCGRTTHCLAEPRHTVPFLKALDADLAGR